MAHLGSGPAGDATGAFDPLEGWDAERRRCPVAPHADARGPEWVVHGHPEALAVLRDHATFSSVVSRHLSVPSGMDPPEHGP